MLLLTVGVWQGGFVFYAAVVVPTGTDVFGHFGQGLVTQRVTHWLNLFGLFAHAAYFWELTVTRPRVWRWVLWAASLVMLNALAVLHLQMDGMIDATAGTVADGFRGRHIAYLWLSTGQWLIAGVLGWATLSYRVQFARPPVH